MKTIDEGRQGDVEQMKDSAGTFGEEKALEKKTVGEREICFVFLH